MTNQLRGWHSCDSGQNWQFENALVRGTLIYDERCGFYSRTAFDRRRILLECTWWLTKEWRGLLTNKNGSVERVVVVVLFLVTFQGGGGEGKEEDEQDEPSSVIRLIDRYEIVVQGAVVGEHDPQHKHRDTCHHRESTGHHSDHTFSETFKHHAYKWRYSKTWARNNGTGNYAFRSYAVFIQSQAAAKKNIFQENLKCGLASISVEGSIKHDLLVAFIRRNTAIVRANNIWCPKKTFSFDWTKKNWYALHSRGGVSHYKLEGIRQKSTLSTILDSNSLTNRPIRERIWI